MPELPEVETVRRQLAPALEGRTFEEVQIFDARLTRPEPPAEIARELQGERVRQVDRLGKYLLVRLESGRVLVIHLRMTGSLRVAPVGTLSPDPYRRALVALDDDTEVAYRDVRRFGTWTLLEPGELEPYLAERLGPEPLGAEFTPAVFRKALAGRRAPIKAVILDQRRVAGVGNIYADEALWRAKLHPRREAGSLSTTEAGALHRAIRKVLELGIERQGSTLRDYGLPDGSSGGMQREFKVYGRLDEPCERCGTPIEWIVVVGRGTWYCPVCQTL